MMAYFRGSKGLPTINIFVLSFSIHLPQSHITFRWATFVREVLHILDSIKDKNDKFSPLAKISFKDSNRLRTTALHNLSEPARLSSPVNLFDTAGNLKNRIIINRVTLL